MSNNNETKTPITKKNSSRNTTKSTNTVEITKVSRKTKHYNVKNTDKRKNNSQVVIPCYEGKHLIEPNDVKRIEKFKNKNHGYRNPPKNTFFVGDIHSSFVVIPVKRKKCSWLFSNPLTNVSSEIIFRFFKKNINILNHNNNLRIKYENYCDKFKERYGESKISYKDLALKTVIDEMIIGRLRKKKHSIACYIKSSRKVRKELSFFTTRRDEAYYRYLKYLTKYTPFLFYELEFVKGNSVKRELFFAVNIEMLTSLSSDPTKKWTTRIDLFDDIRVVKQMPTDYFPYNSRIGIIDLASNIPHMKTITLSKSTQILEIMKCKKENIEKLLNDDIIIDKLCYAVCLKKLR